MQEVLTKEKAVRIHGRLKKGERQHLGKNEWENVSSVQVAHACTGIQERMVAGTHTRTVLTSLTTQFCLVTTILASAVDKVVTHNVGKYWISLLVIFLAFLYMTSE